jgi:hypothetical protein
VCSVSWTVWKVSENADGEASLCMCVFRNDSRSRKSSRRLPRRHGCERERRAPGKYTHTCIHMCARFGSWHHYIRSFSRFFVHVSMKQLSSAKNESCFFTLQRSSSESKKPETPYLSAHLIYACISFTS